MSKKFDSRRKILKLAGVTMVAGFTGCLGRQQTPKEGEKKEGGEDHKEGESVPHEPVSSIEVEMKTEGKSSFHFEPHVAWIEKGGAVTWINKSGDHTTTAYHPKNEKSLRIPENAESWDSGLFEEKDATFKHTFDVEGIYDYYCIPHEAAGMLGSIIVGEPSLEGQLGLATPQESLPKGARQKMGDLNHMVEETFEK